MSRSLPYLAIICITVLLASIFLGSPRSDISWLPPPDAPNACPSRPRNFQNLKSAQARVVDDEVSRDPDSLTTDEFFDEFFSRGRPVVLRGAAKGSPGIDTVNFNFLLKHFGRERGLKESIIGQAEENTCSKARAPSPGQILNLKRQHPELRGIYLDLGQHAWGSGVFENMFPPPLLLDGVKKAFISQPQTIYFGGPSRGLDSHQDFGSCSLNYQVQVLGTKRWYMHSPLADDNGEPAYYFDVHAGDVLVFAPQVWHQTEVLGEGDSLALTYYGELSLLWRDDPNQNRTFYESLWRTSQCAQGTPVESYGSCYSSWFEPPSRGALLFNEILFRVPRLKLWMQSILGYFTLSYCPDDEHVLEAYKRTVGLP